MRLIDADALIRRAIERYKENMGTDIGHGMGVIASMITDAPTIDAVPVVRCRECKHNVANWNHDELDMTDYSDITCDFFMTDGMESDDFCSYGERQEVDGNG